MTQFKAILAAQSAIEQGIEYKVTGERERGLIHSYHSKPSPLFHNRGAKSSDVTALTPRDLSNVIMGGHTHHPLYRGAPSLKQGLRAPAAARPGPGAAVD